MDSVFNILMCYDNIVAPTHINLVILKKLYDYFNSNTYLRQPIQDLEQPNYREVAQLFKIIYCMKHEQYTLLILERVINTIDKHLKYIKTKYINGYYYTKDIIIPDKTTYYKQIIYKVLKYQFIQNLEELTKCQTIIN